MGNLPTSPLVIVEEPIADGQPAASSAPPSPSKGSNKRQRRTDSPGSLGFESQSFATAQQSLSQLSIRDGQREQNEEGKSFRVIASNDSDILSYSANKRALPEQAKLWSGLYTGTNPHPTLLIVDLEHVDRELVFLHSFAEDGTTLRVRGDNGLGEIAEFIARDNDNELMVHASYKGQTNDKLPPEVEEMMRQLVTADTLIEVAVVANHSLGVKRVKGELHFTHER